MPELSAIHEEACPHKYTDADHPIPPCCPSSFLRRLHTIRQWGLSSTSTIPPGVVRCIQWTQSIPSRPPSRALPLADPAPKDGVWASLRHCFEEENATHKTRLGPHHLTFPSPTPRGSPCLDSPFLLIWSRPLLPHNQSKFEDHPVYLDERCRSSEKIYLNFPYHRPTRACSHPKCPRQASLLLAGEISTHRTCGLDRFLEIDLIPQSAQPSAT
jgi:hypothetical protein